VAGYIEIHGSVNREAVTAVIAAVMTAAMTAAKNDRGSDSGNASECTFLDALPLSLFYK